MATLLSGAAAVTTPAAAAKVLAAGSTVSSGLLSQFNEAKIEDIFQSGLHEYIQAFLGENGRLGQAIHDQYLS